VQTTLWRGERKKQNKTGKDKEIGVQKISVLAPVALLYLTNEVQFLTPLVFSEPGSPPGIYKKCWT